MYGCERQDRGRDPGKRDSFFVSKDAGHTTKHKHPPPEADFRRKGSPGESPGFFTLRSVALRFAETLHALQYALTDGLDGIEIRGSGGEENPPRRRVPIRRKDFLPDLFFHRGQHLFNNVTTRLQPCRRRSGIPSSSSSAKAYIVLVTATIFAELANAVHSWIRNKHC